MPAINKICRSLLFSPHHLGNLQNFAVDRGHHHSVKFTVRTGLFGLKETSTEYHETEFSQANGDAHVRADAHTATERRTSMLSISRSIGRAGAVQHCYLKIWRISRAVDSQRSPSKCYRFRP
ncbi:hypothetical protein SCLCIDRAFT_929655 [Scleroderma citrinum Foug A]|uniref:Uncharacterized protein n=1 Tax=Scleroderma citrinum Foug A TaxID=1036808 RepID=A0A0C3DJC2_9AGAM|nr:hypothetical protein SCLCIDRAFT_929655 [Scleroderma citrinum Foug A]